MRKRTLIAVSVFIVVAGVVAILGSRRWLSTQFPVGGVAYENDFINRAVLGQIKASQEEVPEAYRATATALVLALVSGKPVPGVTFGFPSCSKVGCRVEVQYANVDSYWAFNAGKYDGKSSHFEQWRFGAGHTGLLFTTDKRLVANWYFMHPRPELAKDESAVPAAPTHKEPLK